MTATRKICCCPGCSVFFDSFTRTEENIAEDGVNVLDSDRYVFADGEWEVNLGTGELVCLTTAAVIQFYDVPGVYNAFVTVKLNVSGDYGEINFGGGWVRVTLSGSDTVWTSSTGATKTVAGGAGYKSLFVKFFKAERYASLMPKFVPEPDFDLLAYPGITCQFDSIDLPDEGYSVWSLVGSEGVSFDDLALERAAKDCEPEPDLSCSNVCWPNPPASLTIPISGLVDGRFWCGPETYSGCETECIGTVDPPVYPDPLLGPFCPADCDYAKALQACINACLSSEGACYVGCPASGLNGAIVLDRTGDPEDCSCHYEALVSIGEGYGCLNGETTGPTAYTALVAATVSYLYYDAETETTYISITVGIPVAHADTITTGPVDASLYCEGGSMPLSDPGFAAPEDRAPDGICLTLVAGSCCMFNTQPNTTGVDYECSEPGDDPGNPATPPYVCQDGPNEVGNGCGVLYPGDPGVGAVVSSGA